MKPISKLVAGIFVSFSLPGGMSASADWPAALLPPGVRTEDAASGGMMFPVLLAEVVFPLAPDAQASALPLLRLDFSPDGKQLAIGCAGVGIRLLDIYGNRQVWEQGGEAFANLETLAFSACGKQIYLAGGGKMTALSAHDGSPQWGVPAGLPSGKGGLQVVPVAEGAILYATGNGAASPGAARLIDVEGKPVWTHTPGEGGTLVAVSAAGSTVGLLEVVSAPDQAGTRQARVALLDAKTGEARADYAFPTEKVDGPVAAGASLSVSADEKLVAVALPGSEPFVLAVGDKLLPEVLRTGGGVFRDAMCGGSVSAGFLGSLPDKTKTVAADGMPTTFLALDVASRKKWRVEGMFVAGSLVASADGRWLAVLADQLPARGSRGRGLALFDTRGQGRGEQHIAYTYTTRETPPGIVAMADDGSAIAFGEFRELDKKTHGAALVVNVIR